jgi:hypothetical protein
MYDIRVSRIVYMSCESLIHKTCNRQAKEGHNVLTKTYTPMRFYTLNNMGQILGGVMVWATMRWKELGGGLAKVDGSCGLVGGSQGSAQLINYLCYV